ncbi:methylenetetrahydrofolate reductase [Quadrisphaera sp. KR29]|uniref:methylenetetrahydrofolate reductase n=1 Tax=Quadrisphaera sp. KR29 TaxID=3461391 RepID=UPI0040440BAE
MSRTEVAGALLGPVTEQLRAVASGRRTRPVLSVELFPPRPQARAGFGEAVGHLVSAGLDFASVTYGAGGSSRAESAATVAEVHRVSAGVRDQDADPGGPAGARAGGALPVLAHLTCVSHGPEEVLSVARELVGAGATGFLALRGDPPRDPGWRPPPDAVPSSADLVRLLGGPDLHPGPHLGADRRALDLAVAAFPGGHPASAAPSQDIAALRAKVEAGAGFALTQVVFDAAEYTALRERAAAAGLDVPLVPGVLPVTDPQRVQRVARLAGVEPPPSVLAALSGYGEDERCARHRLGVQLTARLCRDLLDAGAPGLHLYSMNRHEAVVDVLDALDLLPVPACSCPGGRS